MSIVIRFRLVACALALGAPATVRAADATPADAAPSGPSADAAPFGEAARLGGESLAKVTGRDDTSMVVRAQNSSTVANNSVSGNSVTGTISFDAQSFQALSGLSLLSANTGNNVSINSSLNVNVAIQR